MENKWILTCFSRKKLYLLIPSKICWLVDMLVEDKDLSIVDAIKTIYTSDLYRKLQDESTKIWHLGPVALYEELLREI